MQSKKENKSITYIRMVNKLEYETLAFALWNLISNVWIVQQGALLGK